MKSLSRIEEALLLAILKLGDNAYGVSIRKQIYEDTREEWSFASIYTPLDKLKRQGLVKKVKGESLPIRGGKSKYYYHVTEEGKKILKKAWEKQQKMWSDVPLPGLETKQ